MDYWNDHVRVDIDLHARGRDTDGQPNRNGWGDWASCPEIEADDLFSLREYLDCVMEGQSAQYVQNLSEADVTLTMEKSPDKHAVSLVDNNFFLEC